MARRTYPSRRTGEAVYRTPSRVTWARRRRRVTPTAAGTAPINAVLHGASGLVRHRATLGSVSVTDILPAGNSAIVRLRTSTNTVLTVQAALPVGSAGSIRVGAASGTVSTGSVSLQTGQAAVVRLMAGRGSVLAVRPVAPVGSAAAIRIRPGSGQVTAVAHDGTVTVSGCAGVLQLRPGPVAVFVQSSPAPAGIHGGLAIRAGSGFVLTSDEPAVTAGGLMIVHERPGATMRPREQELEGV